MSQRMVRLIPQFQLRRVLLGLLALSVLVGWLLPPVLSRTPAGAQAPAEMPVVKGANYKQAYKYSNEFLKQFVYSSSVSPNWIGKGDTFWYQYTTSKGKQWYRVNAREATKEPLFDRVKLGAQLSEQVRKPLDPNQLPLGTVSLNDDGSKMKFVTEGVQFEYDMRGEKLAKLGKAPEEPKGGLPPELKGKIEGVLGEARFQELMDRLEMMARGEIHADASLEEIFADLDMYLPDAVPTLSELYFRQDVDPHHPQVVQDIQDAQQKKKGGKGQEKKGDPKKGAKDTGPLVYSPDGKLYVFAQNNELFLGEEGKEEGPVKLSKDSAPQYSFGGGAGKGGGKGDGGTGIGGEVFDQKKAEKDKDQKSRPNVTWAKDSKSFYATRADTRGLKSLFLVNSVANPRPTLTQYTYPMPGEENIRRTELHIYSTGLKKLVRVTPKWKDETYSNFHWGKSPSELRFMRNDRLHRNSEFCSLNMPTGECKCMVSEGFENANLVTQPQRYLDESDEMIWWSERSNWGHYYLYDRSGKMKNAITAGDFRASAIVNLDTKNRMLYFRGNAREPGENVYFNHLYSVRFDGTGMTLLDPGDGNHNSELSPSKQFVVDNYSRFDMAPVSVLRDSRGNKIMDLEKADLSKLYEVGWKMPEAYSVKAADGVTDLYVNMWKPFDFDAKKKYPIIAHVYPGPQTESMTHSFQSGGGQQQLAQLNFIVIQVGNRGGTPLRSKHYQSHSYWNMRDYGLADKKTAIEQLCARCSFMDIDRIGIYGHSGGGFMSTAALVVKPYNEFFKVAVSSAGNHDNNVYNNSWAERYHGMKELPGKKEDAKKDDGKKGFAGAGKGLGKGGKKKGADDLSDLGGIPQKKGKKTDDQKQDEQKKGDEQKKDEQKGDMKDKTDKDVQDKKGEKGKGMEDKKDEKAQETYFSIRVPTNPELAANLKGKLLLVHGDMDNNVHPAHTIRMADALIKANKRFDLLIMPGQAHGFGPMQAYFNQRMWEYFAEHLLFDRTTSADLYDRRDKMP